MAGKNERKMTANEFTNVKDIKKIYLYTKDGYVFCYLRIYSFNLDLLSPEEKRQLTASLAASFDGDRKDFVYFTFPREIDLDKYKSTLKAKYTEEMASLGRKHILRIMLQEAAELATNGENYEHQHFIKIWKKVSVERSDAEQEIRQRIEEFRARYAAAGIPCEIMQASDILKMCNLFGNALQAPFETSTNHLGYEAITKMR